MFQLSGLRPIPQDAHPVVVEHVLLLARRHMPRSLALASTNTHATSLFELPLQSSPILARCLGHSPLYVAAYSLFLEELVDDLCVLWPYLVDLGARLVAFVTTKSVFSIALAAW